MRHRLNKRQSQPSQKQRRKPITVKHKNKEEASRPSVSESGVRALRRTPTSFPQSKSIITRRVENFRTHTESRHFRKVKSSSRKAFDHAKRCSKKLPKSNAQRVVRSFNPQECFLYVDIFLFSITLRRRGACPSDKLGRRKEHRQIGTNDRSRVAQMP